MAVNQAGADKEIRSQLVSTLESGHNHMALAEAGKAFPTSAINSRLPRVPYTFWHLVEHIRLARFHTDLEAVIELVRDPTRDLFVTVPSSAGKHTFFRCCLVTADHNSYHTGELAIGRKVAGLWPKGRKD